MQIGLVILNDATAELGWTRLRHGDRLELSGARIQVALAPDLRTARPTLAMEAPAHRPSAPSLPVVEKPSAAIVRLVRGHSDRFAWVFRANDLGASVSIGAGRHCDWPISTGGFDISELTLLFAGGVLLARREHPGDRLRLNGAPLGDDWTFVSPGSRIDIGLACLEFQLSTDHASLPPLPPCVCLPRGSSPQTGPSPNAHHGANAQQATAPAKAKAKPKSKADQGSSRQSRAARRTTSLDRTSQRAELVLRTGAGLARVTNGPTELTHEGRPPARPRRHAVETSRQSMEAMRPHEAWVQACIPATRRVLRAS